MSVPVTGTIVTYGGGLFPTHVAELGQGGCMSFASSATRNAFVLTYPLRCERNMLAVLNDGSIWYLNTSSPIGNDSDWTRLTSAGGSIALSGDATGSGTSSITVTVSSYDGGTPFGTMAAQNASAVDITGGTITGLPSPTGGSDAVPKSYVDSLVSGLSPRTSCRVGTTVNLTATYSNGFNGVGATLTNSGVQAALVIDDVTLSVADRVLVKDQTDWAQNGIYVVSSVGSVSTNWMLTRATDYDQPIANELTAGSYVVVVSGTDNSQTLWVETEPGPFTIGVTAIQFSLIQVGVITTTLSGDVTGTGIGDISTTIADNAVTTSKINAAAVTYAKIQAIAASSILGNPTGSPATVSEITLGSGLGFSGSTLIATGSGGTVTSVATGSGLTGGPVTTTGTISLASILDGTVLANTSGGTAVPVGTTPSVILDVIGSTQGDILYRGATAWAVLAPGTSGQVLATQGSSANPHWVNAATGTVTSVATGTGLDGGTITTTGTISLAAISDGTILGNDSGVSAAPGEITIGSGLTMSGGTLSATGGSGTVTTVSVASANGFAGTVANATSTPAITLTTTITGILKGDGTAISAATAGSDYLTGNQTVTLSGDVSGSGATSITTAIGSGKVLTAMIAAANVTYAKIQNVSAVSLLGNPTGSAAAPSEITLGSGLSFSGTTLVASGGSGTVTSISGSGAVETSPSPITGIGTVRLAAVVDGAMLANKTGGSSGPAATDFPSYFEYVFPSLIGALYYRGSSAWSTLAGQTTTTKKFLTQTGTGSASAAPGWNVIVAGDIAGLSPGSHAFGVSGTPVLNAVTPPIFLDRAVTCDGLTVACGTAPSGGSLTVTLETSTDGTTWSALTSGAVSATTGTYSGTAACTTAISANTYVHGKFTAVNGAADVVAEMFIRS